MLKEQLMKNTLRTITTLVISLIASVASAAPIPEDGWGLPRDVSVDGHRIDWLIEATTFFIVILFAVMCIWMALAVVKHGRDHTAEYDHGDSGHHVAFAMGLVLSSSSSTATSGSTRPST